MSKAQPTLASEPSAYAPVSGLAVVSLAVAAIFATIVLVVGGVAFFYSTPMLMPTWVVLVPLLAIVLALLAQREIRASEGTRSGGALAGWALGLSLLFGLGYYLCYLFPTYKALTLQADDFSQKWFDKIRQGDVNEAFLETLEVEQRVDNPRDEKTMDIRFGSTSVGRKGPLTQFKDSEMVQLLAQAGPQSTITNLGVRTWDWEKDGYRVQQVYRLSSAEGEFDLLLTAYRSDRGGRRSLRIAYPDSRVEQQTLSARGRELRGWQVRSRQFATTWLNERNRGNLPALFLYSRAPAGRPALDRDYQAAAFADALARVGGNLALGPASAFTGVTDVADARLNVVRFLPGFHAFTAASVLDLDKLQADPQQVNEVRSDLANLFQPGSPLRARLAESGAYQILPDQRVAVAIDFELSKQTNFAGAPSYLCVGRIHLESDIGLDKLEAAPDWRVTRLEVLRAGVPAPDEPGKGPPGGPGAAFH